MSRINPLSLGPSDFEALMVSWGYKPFVARQILTWVFHHNVTDLDQMTNLSKSIRGDLAERLTLESMADVEVVPSGDSSATKFVLTLLDGKKIECVVLHEKAYNTLCVSSQCGCPVDCKFCLTGVVGFKRNLEVHEIIAQITVVQQRGFPITNLVFMGMGEPLLNYDNVFKAIDIITSEAGFHLSKRNITVSTSGYLAGIKRLIADQRAINLAFSVGNANPVKRARIMPIEGRNSIIDVAKTLHDYQSSHNRKLTLEYTLLHGQNDSEQDIKELANLAKYLNAKVNLINLNPHIRIPFKPVSSSQMAQARDWLKKLKVPVTIRFRRGQEISAACGQLGESHLAG
ncbi:23S rRNA (adenine(2503)-C(2))-methyltransferase RlmN [bacterium]|nr:23S rRNA (adenine(2503)-C(2))-methyltransferase RlmN [bacterium]